ncbi:unnamed protein product [Polarella glacialis]|uniref:Alpha/beta hydrolase fold-5 domain-containing protein n=1 Tax=Polarella glacialis TaxID=89957 RepID=A0A813EUA5_POLGL|nr:unnamed protein product [Polarella glacialis]
MRYQTAASLVLVACFSSVVVPFAAAADDEHIVLKPQGSSSTPQKMLVFIPGGKVPNQHYEATARAIQAAAAEKQINLWVVIPAVFQRLCIISCTSPKICAPLHGAAEAALTVAQGQGWARGTDSEDLWLAGHSLGGVCANTLFQAYSSPSALPYAGLIVMGSYVDETGDHDLVNFPTPVLTLNVELDGGLARPGKTSVWWRQHLELMSSKGEGYALANKPVIVLPELNHTNFCPGFDVPGDLPAEVDQATATGLIGQSVAAFLVLQMNTSSTAEKAAAAALLSEQVAWTKQLLTPYLKAQDLERMPSDTKISAEGASPFCAHAQHMVAGMSDSDDARIEVQDGFHVDSQNLEHCHPNWTSLNDGRILIRSCGHTDYYPDISNTGTITAASEIACKMLSSDRVAEQLKTVAAVTNVPCSEGNRYAVSVAEQLAAPSTLERFRSQGRGWCFLDDAHTAGNIGPLWVFKDALQLEENATCMSVTSPVLFTELDDQIYPGSHYCKFLSPARALDWMMTDSLKPGKKSQKLTEATAATAEILI